MPRTTHHRWLALAVLCVTLLLVTLDNTILNVALPTLVRDLGASSSQLQWVVDAYAMVFAGLLLVGGSLGDRFGRKRTFLTGLMAFAVASAWSAFSGDIDMLIAARSSMGIGAALIMPATLSIITNVFTDPVERQRAIGVWAAMSGLGIAIGPIAGGFLLAHFWWGSIFLINVPLAAVGLACAIPLVPDSKDPSARRPDPVGGLLSIAGLGLVLWAIIEAPTKGWDSGRVLGAGLGGVAVLAVFAAWEWWVTDPMLNLDFYRSRRFSAASASMGLVMFGLFGAMFVLTQFLQFSLGYSAIAAGLRVLPVAAVLAVAAPLSALAVRRVGTKLVVVAGLLSVATGLYLLTRTTTASGYADTLGGMILLGLGAGLVMPAAADSVMGSLPAGRTGVGSATNGVSIQVCGALGVAVVGSLLFTRYQDRVGPAISGYPMPPAAREKVLGSIGGALEVAGRAGGTAGVALGRVARSAFISGMDLGLLAACGVAGGAAVMALLALPSRPQPSPSTDEPARAAARR